MKGRRVAAAVLTMLFLLAQRTWAVDISATAAVLMDADTGRILYEKNPDRRMLVASTTKILTALVVLESCELRSTVKVTQEHMAEGSSMYLKPGEEVTVECLLYGLLLASGNDAALALAEACGGVEPCVGAMNRLAGRIGMTDSHFENPNGLDGEAHYSTARDMAKLASYASKQPTFLRICSTTTAHVGGRTMTNHNRLLREVEGCMGMKTGYTKAAGRTLVSCVEREGRTLVAVTLQDGNDWAEHRALYEFGFSRADAAETAAVRGRKDRFWI